MNPIEADASPACAFEMNGVGAVRLMGTSIEQHISKFVYLYTSNVFGSALSGIVTEEICTVPNHPYSTSHKAFENLVDAAVVRNRVQEVIIRLTNSFDATVLSKSNCWNLLIPD